MRLSPQWMTLALCLSVGMAAAAPFPLIHKELLPEGKSPDGKWGAYLVQTDVPGAYPELSIRRLEDDSELARFITGGYRTYFDLNLERTEVHWSPGSNWLAVTSQGTKRTIHLTMIHVGENRAEEGELPAFGQNLLGRLGVLESGRSWFEKGLGWEDEQHFTLEVSGGEGYKENQPQAPFQFEVTLEVARLTDSWTNNVRAVAVRRVE